MTSTIKVDTISENTSANGVAVDGVTLKDGAVGAAGTATSVAGIPLYKSLGHYHQRSTLRLPRQHHQ